jgi:DNA polymerase III subunit epsilon
MTPPTYAIIDFETTGISPQHGACPTEVAIVRVRGDEIVDCYQSLMNGGVRLSPFIEAYTGITNAMVRRAPPLTQVMAEAHAFAADDPLIAHNARFDSQFWDDAMQRIGKKRQQEFICSMLIARRIYTTAPNHKLATLANYLQLPVRGEFHRALADAEVTAHIFIQMQQAIRAKLNLETVSLQHLIAVQRQKIGTF